MNNKEETRGHLSRFSGRILRGYSAYSLWKTIKTSINSTTVGLEKADENVQILNCYREVFPSILFSLETAFIIELHKFFDKSRKGLKLVDIGTFSAGIAKDSITSETKKNIKKIVESNKKTIDQISKLRHQLFAHDQFDRQEELFIPPINDLDKLFRAVKEILNEIAKCLTSDYYIWTDEDDSSMEWIFSEMLINLNKGREQRFYEQNEKWKREYQIKIQ